MGIYNAGAALFRAMGNSKVSMFCSLVVNVINITVNAVLIFGFGMGAAGAGIGTLVSRIADGRHYHGAAQPPRPCAPGGGSAAF